MQEKEKGIYLIYTYTYPGTFVVVAEDKNKALGEGLRKYGFLNEPDIAYIEFTGAYTPSNQQKIYVNTAHAIRHVLSISEFLDKRSNISPRSILRMALEKAIQDHSADQKTSSHSHAAPQG